MQHLRIVSRLAKRPERAADMDQIAKVFGEALTLTSQFLATLATWETVHEQKAE